MLGKGYRIAAGKLRLCIQASLRWDDLQRTPFMNVEWVRRTGENCIIGLRSKFGDSKTGPRHIWEYLKMGMIGSLCWSTFSWSPMARVGSFMTT